MPDTRSDPYQVETALGALTVLVPRLGAHRRKALQLHQKIEKAIGSKDLDDAVENEREFRAKLRSNLAQHVVLSPLEERVLRLRFGIGVAAASTEEEICEQLSLKLTRVRKIQAEALRKLAQSGL
ncbi:MAG TPA: sigma factor-like helix-turn-helix DNA-binding protein [Micropepsaceae bacterium]|nr:sigma factor-like helix-turn-helix DNA-binding protein [Micropepsaceae bacterium]